LLEVVQRTGLTFASDYIPSYRNLQENQSQSINNE